MPEGYTHLRIARRAAKAARCPIACPAAFAIGANGPDALFCFEAWKPARKRRADLPALGERMHEENTGALLQYLAAHARTPAQRAYTLGFLSHYAADTTLHPFVAALCQPGMPYAGAGGHGYFEIALDSTLHAEDTGSALVPAEETSPLLPGPDLAEVTTLLHAALADAYGLDIPVEYLADAFYDLHRLRRLFVSRHGVRRALFWLAEPLFGGRGRITGHISPRRLAKDLPETWTDPYTGEARQGGAFPLLRQAEKRSALYMLGAAEYWAGRMPAAEFFALLGSSSYSQGRATPQSDPRCAPPPAGSPDETTAAAPVADAPATDTVPDADTVPAPAADLPADGTEPASPAPLAAAAAAEIE